MLSDVDKTCLQMNFQTFVLLPWKQDLWPVTE